MAKLRKSRCSKFLDSVAVWVATLSTIAIITIAVCAISWLIYNKHWLGLIVLGSYALMMWAFYRISDRK